MSSAGSEKFDHSFSASPIRGMMVGQGIKNETREEMALNFKDIGQRLRAFRLGKGLNAELVAEKLGISRAAVYRLEKGDLVKIETLERLSQLLDSSLPSLLGVEVEYYRNSIAFFERMRQLEEVSTQVIGNFSPSSLLLFSDEYLEYLRLMLLESELDPRSDRRKHGEFVDRVIAINQERRDAAMRRRTPVVSMVGASDLERFLRTGLIGRFDLPPQELRRRRLAARREVERLVDVMERPMIGVQFGVISDMPPSQTCQIFEGDPTTVSLSPYRLGEQPNVTSGIAMVTSSAEAVQLFKDTMAEQWRRAQKHDDGVRLLKDLLRKTAGVLHDEPPRLTPVAASGNI